MKLKEHIQLYAEIVTEFIMAHLDDMIVFLTFVAVGTYFRRDANYMLPGIFVLLIHSMLCYVMGLARGSNE